MAKIRFFFIFLANVLFLNFLKQLILEVILNLNERYTYADYLTWADDKMRELIDGFVRLMPPAPSVKHQIVCGKLTTRFNNLIEKTMVKAKFFRLLSMFGFPKTEKRLTIKSTM